MVLTQRGRWHDSVRGRTSDLCAREFETKIWSGEECPLCPMNVISSGLEDKERLRESRSRVNSRNSSGLLELLWRLKSPPSIMLESLGTLSTASSRSCTNSSNSRDGL